MCLIVFDFICKNSAKLGFYSLWFSVNIKENGKDENTISINIWG